MKMYRTPLVHGKTMTFPVDFPLKSLKPIQRNRGTRGQVVGYSPIHEKLDQKDPTMTSECKRIQDLYHKISRFRMVSHRMATLLRLVNYPLVN